MNLIPMENTLPMVLCKFEIVAFTGDTITIRDLNEGKSVTNDAENVVKRLRWMDLLRPGNRLLYYDTDGNLDEITWTDDGKIGFIIGPR
jgi:hypothetical protein